MYAREMLAVAWVLRLLWLIVTYRECVKTQHGWPQETFFLPGGAVLAKVWGPVVTRCDLPGVSENTAQVAPGNLLPPGGDSSGWGFGTRCDSL